MNKDKLKNKIKAGVAGLLLGATLLTGAACAKNDDKELIKDDEVKITVENITENKNHSSTTTARKDLAKIINNTFSEYVAIEGQNGGETIVLEDGAAVSKKIGCVTAPNGDNVAWFGDNYYSIYSNGQAFLQDNEYPEEAQQYISFKDALLNVINDQNHKIVKINNNTYEINDNDCNVYKLEIKNGKISKVYDTYTDLKSGKSYTSNVVLRKTNEQEFVKNLNEAINQIEDAQEYFNGLTK